MTPLTSRAASSGGDGLRFRVVVEDSFHFANRDECWQAGEFASHGSAVERCRAIVDSCLREQIQLGISADELLLAYKTFGEDPWITPTPQGVAEFSAWDYAAKRCPELTAQSVGRKS